LSTSAVCGCNGFNQKPFEAETLTAKVRGLL